ncbi:hypothetical protein WJX75_000257 [Coccomyxa subellipsoidea]|uniref:Uncharacterized protein n=1 Tax=Coccomyxa subellipsoidea TaxID=248742 RepID=A0ABR2Z244_9CHLO
MGPPSGATPGDKEPPRLAVLENRFGGKPADLDHNLLRTVCTLTGKFAGGSADDVEVWGSTLRTKTVSGASAYAREVQDTVRDLGGKKPSCTD